MDMPRKTKLYNEVAKDYQPKQAEMKICKYIEDMEERFNKRIAELEAKVNEHVDSDDIMTYGVAENGSTDKSIEPVAPYSGETQIDQEINSVYDENKEINEQNEVEPEKLPRRSNKSNKEAEE